MGKVLVVDDDEMTRTVLVRILEIEGHGISIATTGLEALERVRSDRPDLVVMDVAMPDMDGIEACRILKADPSTSAIPVLVLSGMSDRESRLRGIEAGANDYLTKPIDREDLVLRVRNALRMKALHDELQSRNAELLAMQELRESLTQMLIADNRRLEAATEARDRLRAAAGDPSSDAREGTVHA